MTEIKALDPGSRSVSFAKTTRPALGVAVPRERLFLLLDGTPARTVGWISGPPGCGKTTLAASYVEARGLRCLWYQIDADDVDVASFFHHLAHAARKLEGVRLSELPGYTADSGGDSAAFARRFFRQLFSSAKPPFALVLDNLHGVPLESALHTVIEAAFSQIPRGACAIVTSRSEPPPAFARLRVTGEMVCVGGENLRVQPEELARIAQMRGHVLDAAAVSQLHERTHGWTAGLVLMLEHAKLAGRIIDLPGDAAPEVVFDYLAGEIFDRFETRTQKFLLSVACLPRMTTSVARALSGEEKAPRLLINLTLNNYFVTETRSPEGHSYELHPLLRDFLRNRAARDLPHALAADHLKRAAGLLLDAGDIEDAMSLYIECRDWSAVAGCADLHADGFLAQGRSELLAGWLESLPADVLERSPRLLKSLGACRLRSGPRSARRCFELAYEGFRLDGDRAGMAICCRGVIDASILEFDDLVRLDHWCEQLAGLLPPGVPAGAEGVAPATQDALAALVAASLLRDAGRTELDGWLTRTELPIARALVMLLRGDLGGAAAAIAIERARAGELPPRRAMVAMLAAALVDLAAGRHPQARRTAEECLGAAEAEGVHGYDAWLRALAGAAALGGGDGDAARGQLQRLEVTGAGLRRGDRALLHYLRGWLAALDGDAVGAQREVRTAVSLAAETGVAWLECLARAAHARLLAASGDRRASDSQLRAADGIATRQASAFLDFVVRLAAADAARACGDETGALAALRAAFALGREHGCQHLPGWSARDVAGLCVFALAHGIEPEFARGLIRANALAPTPPPLRVAGWPWPLRIATLGTLQLQRNGEPIEFSVKGPGRPAELLKVLIALGGQNVRTDQIADALWPNVDADYAHKSFTAALHRLRRLLDDDSALILRDSRLGLNPVLVWTDLWALEHALAEIEEVSRASPPGRPAPRLQALAHEMLTLYRGPFLSDEAEQPSYIACREQIRARVARCLTRLGRQWEDSGAPETAVDCYLRCIESDKLFEAPYRHLMLLHQRRGELAEARAIYEQLRTVLSMRLKVLPSAEAQAIYAALKTPARA